MSSEVYPGKKSARGKKGIQREFNKCLKRKKAQRVSEGDSKRPALAQMSGKSQREKNIREKRLTMNWKKGRNLKQEKRSNPGGYRKGCLEKRGPTTGEAGGLSFWKTLLSRRLGGVVWGVGWGGGGLTKKRKMRSLRTVF